MDKNMITVVGAVNMDIGGKPYQKLNYRDSNPGTVTISPGGVGRNIAHNLRLLDNTVHFISALGMDENARRILESCRELGIDISDCLRTAEAPTSTYLYIARDDGDLELAISDMTMAERITPEFIRGKMNRINGSRLVIADANLPEETIREIVQGAKVPVFAETVSCKKAEKWKSVLPGVFAITPNILEAEILTDRSIDPNREESVAEAAKRLLDIGVKQVVITMGPGGAYFADQEDSGLLPPLPSHMVSGNGAGDALMAGLATGYALGCSFRESVMLGMAAASTTLESEHTNNENMNLPDIMERSGVRRQHGA